MSSWLRLLHACSTRGQALSYSIAKQIEFGAATKAVKCTALIPVTRIDWTIGSPMRDVIYEIWDCAVVDCDTGYSSLSYLRRFPFDKIKIDRSFINDVTDEDGSLSIVQAVVGIAKSRNIATVAEGVETTLQLELLRKLGCASPSDA